MCGISGILDYEGNLSSISAMTRIQRHRGPDDEGYLFANTGAGEWMEAGGADTVSGRDLPAHESVSGGTFDLVLGSRRLAVVDLSPRGHMPLSYLGGAYWITYNGEIYNYVQLREQLARLGYSFVSDTDTEVILAAYAEWGTSCLSHFNGMFAFALWDRERQRLFCGRDRLGVKPFYYYWDGRTFVFGSEPKVLLQHPVVPSTPNDQAIFDYLALGLSDHGDQTFFESVLSLDPGHYLLLDIPGRRMDKHRWWQASINSGLEDGSGRQDAGVFERFSDLLEDSVRLRLRSDVPVGSCLSGGLDSSAVVCLANRLLLEEQIVSPDLVGDRQKTFTARNAELEIDEYAFSKKIVRRTGAEENLVTPDGQTLWSEVESFVWHMDEPVNSTSQYAQWNVMRLARQRGVTVLLDGQGGDEILAGYYSYLPLYVEQLLQERGPLAAMRAAWAVSSVGGAPARDMLAQQFLHRLPRRLQRLSSARAQRPLRWGLGGTALEAWQLAPEFQQRHWERRWKPAALGDIGLAGVLYRDVTSTNLPKLLRYEDRNSMAFSLETRLPFLDYRLVEMVFSLPLSYRIHGGWTKWILRRSLGDLLPQEITWRRSKLGFPTPEARWLQTGARFVRQLLEECDTDEVGAYIRPGALRTMRQSPDAQLAATPGLWRIVNLMIWLKLFSHGGVEVGNAPHSVASR